MVEVQLKTFRGLVLFQPLVLMKYNWIFKRWKYAYATLGILWQLEKCDF